MILKTAARRAKWPPVGDGDEATRQKALKKLSGMHKRNPKTVQKALETLQPSTTLDSPQAQDTLQYPYETVLTIWTAEFVQQALQVLEDAQNESAQRVRGRVYLAAINNLDGTEQYKFLKKMKTSYGDNAFQIEVAVRQLSAHGVLAPNTGRYHSFDFLADSSNKHIAAWNPELHNAGCKVAKAHLNKVGTSTQELVIAMRQNLACP